MINRWRSVHWLHQFTSKGGTVCFSRVVACNSQISVLINYTSRRFRSLALKILRKSSEFLQQGTPGNQMWILPLLYLYLKDGRVQSLLGSTVIDGVKNNTWHYCSRITIASALLLT
ncbi:hypothetical protein LINPERPRIM_LOCUS29446 [Linum perenne]